MPRLAVLATYAPRIGCGPTVRRQIEVYAAAAEVIAVSPGGLRDEDGAWTQARAQVIERDNRDYDFASYKVGLDPAGDLGRFELVVLANDSFIGPVMPPEETFEEMAARGVGFWGLPRNEEIDDYVQSYFLGLAHAAVASEALAARSGANSSLSTTAPR